MREPKHIYYRGYSKSCNYRCSYCPFPKKALTLREMECDNKALSQFIEFVEKMEHEITIMFTPYGEALIKPYYQQGMGYLTTLPHVKAVGAQTNLSFRIQDLVEEVQALGGDVSKLRLWCSYHPDMVSEAGFLEQCHKLQSAGISFCVGGVAVPDNIKLLKNIRSNLPASIYMWLNKQDGLRRDYTQEEYEAFSQIDPLFALQFEKRSKVTGTCMAGSESIFVEYNGDYRACNISRQKLGNLYEDEAAAPWACQSSSCRCYLAYVHQLTRRETLLFGEEKYFRIPDKKRIKAFFFDLDGTLLDQEGKISTDKVKALEVLAQTKKLYLATSRPYESAMRKCRAIAHLLAGGIFAGGAYCYDKQTDWLHLTTLSPEAIDLLKNIQNVKVKVYKYEEQAYKVILQGTKDNLKQLHKSGLPFHTTYEKGILSLTAKDCHKGSGLQHFIQKLGYNEEEIVVVGNSTNDIPIMCLVKQSICVPNGEEEAKNAATWVLPIEAISVIYADIE